MNDLPVDTTIQLRSLDLKCREVNGTIVVMDLKGSTYLAVEGSIVSAWPMLESGTSLGALGEHLAREYDADPESIIEDLRAIVAQLIERGIVVAGA